MSEVISQKLQQALSPEILEVEDDSASHAGHKEAGMAKESHFNVKVVASCFEGQPPVKRHQTIYAILKEDMKGKIHALSLQTLTPKEYAEKRR